MIIRCFFFCLLEAPLRHLAQPTPSGRKPQVFVALGPTEYLSEQRHNSDMNITYINRDDNNARAPGLRDY